MQNCTWVFRYFWRVEMVWGANVGLHSFGVILLTSHWRGCCSDSLLDVSNGNGAFESFLWLPTPVRLRDSTVLLTPKTWGQMTPELCNVWSWWVNSDHGYEKVPEWSPVTAFHACSGHGLCLSQPLFAHGPRSVELGAFAFQEQHCLLLGKAQEPAHGQQL